MKQLLVLLAVLQAAGSYAQELKQYRSSDNRLYWGNRKPDAAYWQQDIHYKIDATIDEKTHVIHASQQLEYWNNSPDTLYFVYFHLYQNAFVKGSYLQELQKELKVNARLGRYESAGLGTVVENIKVEGEEVASELDNTILKVHLPRPLYPGNHTSISMDFSTFWDNGSTRRRMKMYPAWGFMHYNGVQWFPKIAVYDRKFGWDTYQHMNKEFYGEFGVYEVSLNFPSNYVVEATGALQNRKEVLPDTLRAKLDMKLFANKPWNEPPSTIIPYKPGERKVWRYRAENVHDFAFTADPSYRIATTYWNGVECVGIAQEPHASLWQNSADYVASIIKTFSTEVGLYEYPKMVAADAADGMEYPMLTLDNGADPGYRGLLVHEIAHNWFYGMVGNNETYRAGMDEGFTKYLTAEGLEKIDGPFLVQNKPAGWKGRFWEPSLARDARVYNAYLYNALNGEPFPLNTHSYDFNDALHHENGYGTVYYKISTMLYNLKYTLGDSLFNAAFRNYFHQWKFAHPYPEDFRNSIIHYTNVDLNWFFDQWMETTKTIDYKIKDISRIRGTDSFKISFLRKGRMQMPLDFTVTGKDGARQSYHIPNTWFTKETEARVLPKWYGWNRLHPRYTATVHVPSGLKKVEIDTTDRLADINPLNNEKRVGLLPWKDVVRVDFDGGVNRIPDRRSYRLFWRPDLWWNPVDGIKAGLHFEGSYMNTLHKLKANIWWNTHILQGEDYLVTNNEGWYERYLPVNFTLNYTTPFSVHRPGHELELKIRLLDGLAFGRVGYLGRPDDRTVLRAYFQSMWRPLTYDFDYLIYPNEWSSNRNRLNNSVNLQASRSFKHRLGGSVLSLHLRAPFFTGNDEDDFNYSFLELSGEHHRWIKRFELKARLFGRLGIGESIPQESALWLSGANPEDLMENKFTRSIGFVPDDWRGISPTALNHFQMGGGLNLRGYAGYMATEEHNGEILVAYKGRSGAALNLELDFSNYFRLRPSFTRNWLHIDAYGFFDAGLMELTRLTGPDSAFVAQPTTEWSDLRADAGLGFAFTIKKWGPFEKAKPLTLRVDFPFWINRPPHESPDYLDFRYVIGINRAF